MLNKQPSKLRCDSFRSEPGDTTETPPSALEVREEARSVRPGIRTMPSAGKPGARFWIPGARLSLLGARSWVRGALSLATMPLVCGAVMLTDPFALGSALNSSGQPATAPAPASGTGPTTAPADTSLPKLKASDKQGLSDNLRRRATVTGTVSKAELSNSKKVFRIDFVGARESGFQAVVFERNLRAFSEHFGDDMSKALEGKSVEVTGIVEEYRGKPQIILADPAQLKLLPEP